MENLTYCDFYFERKHIHYNRKYVGNRLSWGFKMFSVQSPI